MMQWMQIVGSSLIITSLASLIVVERAIAQRQVRLTDAEIYRLRNNVEVLLRNQPRRPARLADVLRPQDALQTARSSIAELLFNEGSIARVDENTVFRFQAGLRRFQLPNRVAMNETIFVLDSGTALIIAPPNSVATQIQTPDSVITIAAPGSVAAVPPARSMALSLPSSTPSLKTTVSQATPTTDSDELLPAPAQSSAVFVTYDPARRTTQIFALTDGDISVTTGAGGRSVALRGGQTVAITEGTLGQVQEFDLPSFYQAVPLAAGLGPNQAGYIAEQPTGVQTTLNIVRPETLSAIRNQARRLQGFGNSFLRDALSGSDSDFNGGRLRPRNNDTPEEPPNGTFVVNRYNDDTQQATVLFIPDNGQEPQRIIQADVDDNIFTIDGRAGVSESVGLSGNAARGTVIFQNGRAIRIDIYDVGGDIDEGDRRRGSLRVLPSRTSIPDR